MSVTEKTEKVLKQIIVNQMNEIGDLNPFLLDKYECSKSTAFKILMSEISKNFILFTEHLAESISADILDNMAQTFSFILNADLSNQLSLCVINKHLKKCLGFTILNNEIEMVKKSPKSFIQSKVDIESSEAIQGRLDELINVFDATLHQNPNYLSNKKAFILALYLLENEIKKLDNPIEEISNDYSYFENHFKSKNASLLKEQFSKYKLVEINDDVRIVKNASARIYDSKSDTTIFLCGVEDYLLDYLSRINDINLSLKPSTLYLVNGQYNKSLILEHLEIGEYFDSINFKKKSLTKLYSHMYDTFWVKIDKSNITFEEIIQNSQLNKSHITQVVHSEYEYSNNKLFITHLDHEFIFYTPEEFKARQSNPYQKGSAKKRIKTFKIDDSKIPITEDDNILFMILKIKFKNHKLLEEYFDKVEELN
ncbi:hypothetical protein [Marinicella sp. W31]|uniref:hypothetical protein n=1 Tax=Marinicella sp. W31 TaxID=3023713 RepID=UPI003756A5C4